MAMSVGDLVSASERVLVTTYTHARRAEKKLDRATQRARLANWWSYKLCDDEGVPLICPTCQNIFSGKASKPASPFFSWGSLLCMGLFSIF